MTFKPDMGKEAPREKLSATGRSIARDLRSAAQSRAEKGRIRVNHYKNSGFNGAGTYIAAGLIALALAMAVLWMGLNVAQATTPE